MLARVFWWLVDKGLADRSWGGDTSLLFVGGYAAVQFTAPDRQKALAFMKAASIKDARTLAASVQEEGRRAFCERSSLERLVKFRQTMVDLMGGRQVSVFTEKSLEGFLEAVDQEISRRTSVDRLRAAGM